MTEGLDPELPAATAPRPRSLILIGLSLHILPLLIWGKLIGLALIFLSPFTAPAGLAVIVLVTILCALTIFAWRRNTLAICSLHLALCVVALGWVPLLLSALDKITF